MIQLFIFHSANKGRDHGEVKYNLGITDQIPGNDSKSVRVSPGRKVTVQLERDLKDSFRFSLKLLIKRLCLLYPDTGFSN